MKIYARLNDALDQVLEEIALPEEAAAQRPDAARLRELVTEPSPEIAAGETLETAYTIEPDRVVRGWIVHPAPVPTVVPLPALRVALIRADHYVAIDAAVGASGNTELQEMWGRWPTVRRAHPFVALIAAAAGLSDAQIDDLFRLADEIWRQ